MRFISTFSGIEAATVAWSRLGWTPLCYSEVDPFACAVLAHRFPEVPNLGDICEIEWKEVHERYGIVDVFIGGSPCQSFSIAGNRLGLSGESRLMFEYIRAVRELVEASGGTSPRYIVWENVPGALSSGPKGQKGEDFGCLLRELEKCGYGLAWRVLDSQFARVPDWSEGGFRGPVPQRRRRVYLVGSLGSDGAGEILFERSCLRGDHPKGREAREALAEHLDEGVGMGDFAGFKWFAGAKANGIGYERDNSPTITTSDSHAPAVVSLTTANMGGANGGNYNTDVASYTVDTAASNAVCIEGQALNSWDVQSKRIYTPDGPMATLPSGTTEGMNIQPSVCVPTEPMPMRGDTTPKLGRAGDPAFTLRVGGQGGIDDMVVIPESPVCIQGSMVGRSDENGPQGSGIDEDVSFTLNTSDRHAVAFAQNTRDEVRLLGGDGQYVGALAANPGAKQTSYICMENGNSNAVVNDDIAPTLNAEHEQAIVCTEGDKADAMNSNGEMVTGPLCARDWKGVGIEYVKEGKVICERSTC